MGDSLWAASPTLSSTDGTCYGFITWEEARAVCEDVGARLCTIGELEDNNCGHGTGCGYTHKYVWSSSKAQITSSPTALPTSVASATPSTVPSAGPSNGPTASSLPSFEPSASSSPTQLTYYASCGSGNPAADCANPSKITYLASDDSVAVPRCCRDAATKPADETSWYDTAYYNCGDSLWAASPTLSSTDGTCYGFITWEEARAV